MTVTLTHDDKQYSMDIEVTDTSHDTMGARIDSVRLPSGDTIAVDRSERDANGDMPEHMAESLTVEQALQQLIDLDSAPEALLANMN